MRKRSNACAVQSNTEQAVLPACQQLKPGGELLTDPDLLVVHAAAHAQAKHTRRGCTGPEWPKNTPNPGNGQRDDGAEATTKLASTTNPARPAPGPRLLVRVWCQKAAPQTLDREDGGRVNTV
jgi:hypothetical protein